MEAKKPAFLEQEALRLRPTSYKWNVELRRLLAGERGTELLQIGGAHEYVSRLLVDSKDRPKADAAFHQALNKVAQSWRPTENRADYNISILLDLIAAYTPPVGFVKILGYLKWWDKFAITRQKSSVISGSPHDLALLALQSYYLVPPTGGLEDPAFRAYSEFLWRQLGEPGDQPHAFRRLLELGLLSPDDARVGELVKTPGVILEFLHYALGPERRMLKREIGFVFGCCLLTRDESADELFPLYQEFKASAARLGAQIEHSDQLPMVRLANGERIELFLPAAAQNNYMEVRWRELTESGKSMLLAVLAPAD